jgi:hypothetical protein
VTSPIGEHHLMAMCAKLARAVSAVVLVGSLALSPAAPGHASGDEMRREGSCTGHSDWRLEVRHDDADTLEVRFRVDHTPSGKVWDVFLSDNGTRFFAGTRTSNADGEVRVRKLTRDRSGTDRIKAYGYSHASGEVCSGRVDYDR